jgi:hypothetical protein
VGTAFKTRQMSSDVTLMLASCGFDPALFRLGEVIQADTDRKKLIWELAKHGQPWLGYVQDNGAALGSDGRQPWVGEHRGDRRTVATQERRRQLIDNWQQDRRCGVDRDSEGLHGLILPPASEPLLRPAAGLGPALHVRGANL